MKGPRRSQNVSEQLSVDSFAARVRGWKDWLVEHKGTVITADESYIYIYCHIVLFKAQFIVDRGGRSAFFCSNTRLT